MTPFKHHAVYRLVIASVTIVCGGFGCAGPGTDARAIDAKANEAPTAASLASASFNSLLLQHTVAGLPLPADPSQGDVRLLSELASRGLKAHTLVEDPRTTAGIVLAMLPDVVPVLPSDHYFYFDLFLPDGHVGGNLRFSDIHGGVLHCGVYERSGAGKTGYRLLGKDDGIEVCPTTFAGIDACTVMDKRVGVTRTFIIPQASTLPRLAMLPSEEFLSGVRDESGFCFDLVYNHATCTFAYLLVSAPCDAIVSPRAHDITAYAPSHFWFWRDAIGRSHLVSLRKNEVSANTFYDGPFDQVPPRLPLRPFLREAFPGLEEHAQDTMDEHGNWTARSNVRVAIAPYLEVVDDEDALSKARWYAHRWTIANWHPLYSSRQSDLQKAQRADSRPVADWTELHRRAAQWPQFHAIGSSMSQSESDR